MPVASPSAIERINLATTDDPRDAVHKAVAALARGGVLALATRDSLLLAAAASSAHGVNRVRNAAQPGPLAIGLRHAREMRDWSPDLSPTSARLVDRAWPGSVEFELDATSASVGLTRYLSAEVQNRLIADSRLRVNCPRSQFLTSVLSLTPGPLVSARAHLPQLDPPAEVWIDDASHELQPITVVRLNGESWSLTQKGAVTADDLRAMLRIEIVFVCTGNTCRSPMAEALFARALARRLRCGPGELASRGFQVHSAGLAAMPGARAAREAVELLKSRGADLSSHSSQMLSDRMIARADWIVVMTHGHRDAIVDAFPEADQRVRMLDPANIDVEDPFGQGREAYEAAADAIERHVEALIDSLRLVEASRQPPRQ